MLKKTENIHPAVQAPLPVYTELLTGHYRREHPYHAYRERGTEDWLMILTLGGAGMFRDAAGTETIVQHGDITLLRPRTRHDYGVAQSADAWHLIWLHFHPRPFWHEWMVWPELSPGFMRLRLENKTVREKITECFFECDSLAVGSLPHREQFALNALEELLLWCSTQIPNAVSKGPDTRIRAASTYIQENLREKLTIKMIAAEAGLSASRLTQLFRHETGMTPITFLEEQRFARAKLLLTRTTLPVGMIAEEVGFDNAFYFTLRFKRHTGLAPTEYRKRSEDGGG